MKTKRVKIVKGNIFNHRDGQAELEKFEANMVKGRQCHCAFCEYRELFTGLGDK